MAATTLFPMHNAAGRLMTSVVRGAFGSLTWTVPVLLALLGWRYLRHPDRNSQTGRMVIGWLALIIGALGLVHLANGTPQPTDGAAAMRHAGGLIGFFASAPLVAALTPWVAAPLLALIAGFGVLVITATPLHTVPGRLARLRGRRPGFRERRGWLRRGREDRLFRTGKRRPSGPPRPPPTGHRGGRARAAVRLPDHRRARPAD